MRVYQRDGKWGVDFKYVDPKTGEEYRFRKVLHKLKSVVEKRAADISAALVKGTFVDEFGGMFGIQTTKGLTIQDGIDWYLKNYAETAYKKKGYDQVVWVLNNFRDILKNKPIESLSIKDMEQYKTTRRAEIGPSSIDRELGLISGFLNRLVTYEVIGNNPVRGKILYYNESVTRERVATEDEMRRIVTSIANPELKVITLIAFYTGLRLSNVVNLTVENIKKEQGVFVVKQVKMKKGQVKINVLPIADDLRPVLDTYLEKYQIKDRLFTLPDYKVSIMWKAKMDELGISNLHFHDLRHTLSSNIYDDFQEADPKIIQDILGHSKIDMSMGVYTHATIEKKRRAINSAADKGFLGVIEI